MESQTPTKADIMSLRSDLQLTPDNSNPRYLEVIFIFLQAIFYLILLLITRTSDNVNIFLLPLMESSYREWTVLSILTLGRTRVVGCMPTTMRLFRYFWKENLLCDAETLSSCSFILRENLMCQLCVDDSTSPCQLHARLAKYPSFWRN